jgi:hypothetical protein
MSETHILIRLLWMYFPRISEFDSTSEFLGGLNPPRYATACSGEGGEFRVSLKEGDDLNKLDVDVRIILQSVADHTAISGGSYCSQ